MNKIFMLNLLNLRKFNYSKESNKILFTGMIFAIIPFLLLSIFNFPSGVDDFCNAINTKEKGKTEFIFFFYNTFTGRYTLLLVLAFLNPLLYDNWWFLIKIYPLFTFAILFLSLLYFFKSLIKLTRTHIKIILPSICFFSLFLFGVPKPAELFYWFSGTATYGLGIILFLIYLGSLINFLTSVDQSNKINYLILSTIFLIGALGTNESLIMALIFLNFIILIIFSIKKINYALLFIFIVTLASSLISILSPGNSYRAEELHNVDSLFNLTAIFKAIFHSSYFGIVQIFDWINSLILFFLTLLFIPVAKAIHSKIGNQSIIFRINPLFWFIASIIFLLIQIFPAYLATTDVSQRVLNSIYFFFLLTWFFNIFLVARYININFIQFPIKIMIVIILFFSGGGNISQAYFDLVFRAPNYHENLNNRYNYLFLNPKKDITTTPIFERTYQYPKTIYTMDITIDKNSYDNKCYSRFFNISTINIKNEPTR